MQPRKSDKSFVRVGISLPKKKYKRFKQVCQKNGWKVSTRIAILITKDLDTYLSGKERTEPS